MRLMKTRLRMLLDVDGVLAALDEQAHATAVMRGHTFDIAGVSEQRHRYITDHMPDRKHRAVLRQHMDEPGFFRELPVIEGSQEGVDKLLSAGFDVHVCTKPLETNVNCADEKRAWVTEHFPQLKRRINIVPDKSLMAADLLLDDAPKLEWIGRALWRPVIFTRPYNGEGSVWEEFPHWSWEDDPEDLIPFQDFESPYEG
jgi:5'-nucleotidase